MPDEEGKGGTPMFMNSPEREVVISHLIMLAKDSKDLGPCPYITLAEFICGVKYRVFEAVYVDEETGITTGIFRNHKFRCPEYEWAIGTGEAVH